MKILLKIKVKAFQNKLVLLLQFDLDTALLKHTVFS